MHSFNLKTYICFQNRLRGGGHGVAAARMDAKLNVAGWISEQMGGVRLDYLIFRSDLSFGLIYVGYNDICLSPCSMEAFSFKSEDCLGTNIYNNYIMNYRNVFS